MIKQIPATGEHLMELISNGALNDVEGLTPDKAQFLSNVPNSFSLVDVYGRVWAMVGIVETSPEVFESWGIMDPSNGKHMLAITKIVRNYLKNFPAKRIEGTVKLDFEAGHRWLRMLGYKREGLSRYEGYALYIFSNGEG